MSNKRSDVSKAHSNHNYLNTQKSNAHTKVNGQLVQLWFGSANVLQVPIDTLFSNKKQTKTTAPRTLPKKAQLLLPSLFLTLLSTSVYASDLVYVQSASTTNAAVGDSVTLTTTITNNGPDDEANLYVMDTGLGSIENAIITTSQGTMYSDGAWNIGTLANGDTITATITGTVGDGVQGGIIPFKLTSFAQSADPYRWRYARSSYFCRPTCTIIRRLLWAI